jgi:hypothetical protein
MSKKTIKLTQKSIIEYLRKSCELHKCDDDAAIFLSEENGVVSAQYFPSENGPTEAPQITSLSMSDVHQMD